MRACEMLERVVCCTCCRRARSASAAARADDADDLSDDSACDKSAIFFVNNSANSLSLTSIARFFCSSSARAACSAAAVSVLLDLVLASTSCILASSAAIADSLSLASSRSFSS